MSCCAMRTCSTICQTECANPAGTAPRSFGGISFTASSNPTCAFFQSRKSASCARNALSAIRKSSNPQILKSLDSEHSYHVRSRDDESFVGLKIADEHRRILGRDHRRQKLDGN